MSNFRSDPFSVSILFVYTSIKAPARLCSWAGSFYPKLAACRFNMYTIFL